jgi:hypothetical protein
MEQQCASCQAPLRPGSRFCVKCGEPLQNVTAAPPLLPAVQSPVTKVPAPLTTSQSPVMLTIVMQKGWFTDFEAYEMYLDQKKVARWSMAKGITLQTATTVGKHVITMAFVGTFFPKKWELPFVASQGEHLAEITINRISGGFNLTIK